MVSMEAEKRVAMFSVDKLLEPKIEVAKPTPIAPISPITPPDSRILPIAPYPIKFGSPFDPSSLFFFGQSRLVMAIYWQSLLISFRLSIPIPESSPESSGSSPQSLPPQMSWMNACPGSNCDTPSKKRFQIEIKRFGSVWRSKIANGLE